MASVVWLMAKKRWLYASYSFFRILNALHQNVDYVIYILTDKVVRI